MSKFIGSRGRFGICYCEDTYEVEEMECPMPIVDGLFYSKFEAVEGKPDCTGNAAGYIEEYLRPYRAALSGSIRDPGRPEVSLIPSDIHSVLCGTCEASRCPQIATTCGVCDRMDRRACKTRTSCLISCTFTRMIELKIRLLPEFACPKEKSLMPDTSKCHSCRYRPEDHMNDPDIRTISFHDLRLLGHPTVVRVIFPGHRCEAKQEYLRAKLKAAQDGNSYHQIRYSVRLNKKLNESMVEQYPLKYISEATAISYDSIRKMKMNAFRRAKKHGSERISRSNFTRTGEFSVQYADLTFSGERFFLCFQKEPSSPPVLGGVYAAEEWNSLSELFEGRVTKGNAFLSSFEKTVDACFSRSGILYDYLSSHSSVEPSLAAYIVLRLLMRYCGWEIVSWPDLPENLILFYEESWTLFENRFLPHPVKKKDHRCLALLPLFHDRGVSGGDRAAEALSAWREAVVQSSHMYDLSLATARTEDLDLPLHLLSEYSSGQTEQPELIPGILMYYNPEAVPHRVVKNQYEYYYDSDGNLLDVLPGEKAPRIMAETLVDLIAAGALCDDPEPYPLSSRLIDAKRW